MTTIKFPVTEPLGGGRTRTTLVPVEITSEGKHLVIAAPYCPPLNDEWRNMQGAHWCGRDAKNPRRCWTVDDSHRNKWRMDVLRWQGLKADGTPVLGSHDPYERYERPMLDLALDDRPYYSHQPEGIRFLITRRQCILAWEPGTGKTLVAGRAMEWAKDVLGWDDHEFWFVCKNGALYQVQLDYLEWKVRVRPQFMSYETMKARVETWPKGKPAPKFVVFDESTQIKSPTAQRSDKALHLANSMRAEWGPDAFVVLMTGTPSPKDPADWWMQCEVACPGFVREGDWGKFRRRLCLIELRKREDGGKYNDIKKDAASNKVWWDDENKCGECGELAAHPCHSQQSRLHGKGHNWRKSVNEVKMIDVRLRGFVSKKFKRDCLDLPERVYKVIRCRPTQQLLNAARLISKGARGAADALTRLRELSDGFQYQESVVETKKCPDCTDGTMVAKEDPEAPGLPISQEALQLGRLVDVLRQCDRCGGTCEVYVKEREAAHVACPKDEVVEELLDEHADVGRLPIYCGFTGSVDRIVDICLKNKWHVLRVDGRGWVGFEPHGEAPMPIDGRTLYSLFRSQDQRRIAFVAQASTAAHGLNLDNCPTIVNFSRDFNGENAMQGDERNMRGQIRETLKKHGLEKVTVVDIVHLESDYYVLESHKRKRRLQAMTLGEIDAAIASTPMG